MFGEIPRREETDPTTSSAETPVPATGEPTSALRGKLLEQVEEKKREDSAELSKLRGTLLGKKHEETTSPALRGTLLGKKHEETEKEAEPVSALRGSLLEKRCEETEEETELYSPAWLRTQTFIQRDNGKQFVVEDITDSRYGGRIRLKNVEMNQTVTLDLDRFIERIKIPGEAWMVAER